MDFWRTWGNTLAVLGRLKPGISLAQAQAEADLLFPQLRADHKDWWEDYTSTLSSLAGAGERASCGGRCTCCGARSG